MLPALLTALLWTPSLVGLGAVVPHGAEERLRPAIAGFLGLGIAGTVATSINFIAPVTAVVAVVLWATGTALVILRRRWLLAGFDALDLAAPLALVAASALTMRTLDFQYDTGFYHLQALRWIREAPLYLGVANVHSRLGFTSSWPLVAAALELPSLAYRSTGFLNLVPVLFAGSAASAGMRRFATGDRSLSAVLLAGMLLPAASATFGIGGLYVDYTVAMVVYLAAALMAGAVEHAEASGGQAVAALLLSVLGTLLKVSALPALLAACALVLLVRRSLLRRHWVAAGAALLALVPWAARGVLASGCLAFPAASTCAEGLPWAVPSEKVSGLARVVGAWAREPGRGETVGWDWLGPWWDRVLREYPDLLFALGAFALGAAVAVARGRKPGRPFAVAALVGLVGCGYWFLTAPEPRFGLGFVWVLGLAPLALALSGGGPWLERRGWRLALAAALVVAWVGLLASLDGRERTGTLFGHAADRPPLLRWQAIPRIPVVEGRTAAGARVLAPLRGERCWAEPPPCAPATEVDARLGFDGFYFIAATAPPEAAPR